MAKSTAAQPSQLRPKTLNALLGTPKGRIGRAALPTKSPHELRTESENLSWEQDRPAKRQRIEPLLERRAQTSNVVPQRVSFNFQDSHQGMEDFGRLLCSEQDENGCPYDVSHHSLLRNDLTNYVS